MFKTFQNLSDCYIPDNMTCKSDIGKSYTKLDPVMSSRPYELYDSFGNVCGYFWYYGESVTLEFEIDGEVTLDDGSTNGLFIDASDYLKGKIIDVKLYNFRLEEIYSKMFDGASLVALTIDSELSKMFKKGIYYCSLSVIGQDSVEKIFDCTDCKLLVK